MDTEKRMGLPVSVRILSSEKENECITTLRFELPHLKRDILAGEFVMVWIPGLDEIPMSISFWEKPVAAITVKSIGDATKGLANQEVGEWLGIRGPFGTHFSQSSEHALVVGGGIGIAPLRPLVTTLLKEQKKVVLLVGARTENELILYDFETLKNPDFTLLIATDDGSRGRKGYATSVAQDLIMENDFDMIYTCGPELMMAKLYEIAKSKGIEIEASVERYMKCGCGICGTCAIDPKGQLVCVDGPVFSSKKLDALGDFGRSYRDSTGQKKKY
ncbi:MAG: dihydroorotate dehydrogenase electron transfer subunit [Candidatus Thorarchaeota archaeon]|nr:dihydroorotate dehydrogenase electron transfer subunit [Candidatus Thorarchaeota archaeon]MCK5238118.1 dihydroorotate dehydrogenase electron transfer subunit [Candidatus Thorarchaeota archaeon]